MRTQRSERRSVDPAPTADLDGTRLSIDGLCRTVRRFLSFLIEKAVVSAASRERYRGSPPGHGRSLAARVVALPRLRYTGRRTLDGRRTTQNTVLSARTRWADVDGNLLISNDLCGNFRRILGFVLGIAGQPPKGRPRTRRDRLGHGSIPAARHVLRALGSTRRPRVMRPACFRRSAQRSKHRFDNPSPTTGRRRNLLDQQRFVPKLPTNPRVRCGNRRPPPQGPAPAPPRSTQESAQPGRPARCLRHPTDPRAPPTGATAAGSCPAAASSASAGHRTPSSRSRSSIGQRSLDARW